MLKLNDKRLTLGALFLCLFFNAFPSFADGAVTSVFRFQQAMADKGLPQAQYKLAMMYESGSGVEPSLIKAKIWYGRSALQNYKPARHRLTYLDIQQNGYREQHADWVRDLQRDAMFGDGEALFLLGQMYADGTAVPQDTKKSLGLLRKAVAGNVAGSETELLRVEGLYLTQKQAAEQRQQQAAQQKAEELERQKLQQRREQQRLQQQRRERQQQLIAERQRQLELDRQRQAEQARIQRQRAQQRAEDRKARNAAIAAQQQALEASMLVTETDSSSICSGRNRFSATCR